MKVSRIAAILAVASPLFACSSAPGTDDAPAATSDEASPLRIAKSPCPTGAPRTGSTCSDAGLVCSYGEDPRFGCRTLEACNGGKWQSVGDACSSREPACPRKAPSLADGGLTSCTAADLGITCVYDHEAYTCAPCEGNLCRAENYWQTQTLPTACPAAEPNFGQACSVASSTKCSYNPCANSGAEDFGASMSCTGGFWTQSTGTICF